MNRYLLILGLVAALVVGFVILRPQDDDDPPASTVAQPTTATAPRSTPDSTVEAPAPPPDPKVLTIRVKDLAPVGGVREIKVDKGNRLRFNVSSDRPENVHLHGYDIEKPVGPGKVASFSLMANSRASSGLRLRSPRCRSVR